MPCNHREAPTSPVLCNTFPIIIPPCSSSPHPPPPLPLLCPPTLLVSGRRCCHLPPPRRPPHTRVACSGCEGRCGRLPTPAQSTSRIRTLSPPSVLSVSVS
ncbi:hypothetical protein O3P69_017819 [Scylla paramamosain]|uniref:Uncharacterized protein n=1 Tax=Scylla paramamosain TaxID=85552 RepID=A0AAW0SDN5_SCYPA